MSDEASFIIRLIDQATRPAKAIAAATRDIDKAFQKIDKSIGSIKFIKKLDDAGDKLAKFAGKAALAGGAVGIGLGGMFVRSAVDMQFFAERSRLAFKFLTGGAAAGNDAFDRSVKLAKRLGLDVQFVTENMIKLRAMQFSIGEAEDLVKLSADLRAITGNAQAAERAIVAITQIKAKGKLQAEELVQQLAEAGVATTLVYKNLALQLGKTQAEVRALISSGSISADVGIAAIRAAVLEKTNTKRPGQVAEKFAQGTNAGALARLQGAPGLFFLRVADAAESSSKVVRGAIDSIINEIEAIDANKAADFVGVVIEMVPRAIELAKEFAAGFGSSFGEVIAGLRVGAGVASGTKEMWFDIGKTVAQGFGLALKAIELFGKALAFLQTPTGKFILSLGAFFLALPKLIAFGGFLVKAWTLVAGVFGFVAEAAVALWPVIVAIGSGIAALATLPVTAAIAIAVAIAGTVTALVYLGVKYKTEIGEFFVWLGQASYKAGRDLVMGLVNGMTTLYGIARDAAVGLANTITGGIKDKLQIKSPSRLFEQIGRLTTQGFVVGLQLGRPDVEEAGERTFDPGPLSRGLVVERFFSSGGGGSGARGKAPQQAAQIVFAPRITVNMTGVLDPQKIAQEVEDRVKHAFEAFFTDMQEAH